MWTIRRQDLGLPLGSYCAVHLQEQVSVPLAWSQRWPQGVGEPDPLT